jgi:hypothetical protein
MPEPFRKGSNRSELTRFGKTGRAVPISKSVKAKAKAQGGRVFEDNTYSVPKRPKSRRK